MGPAPNNSAGQDRLKGHPQFLSGLRIRGKGSLKSSSLFYRPGTLFPTLTSRASPSMDPFAEIHAGVWCTIPSRSGARRQSPHVIHHTGEHMWQGGCRPSLMSSGIFLSPKVGKGGGCYPIANWKCPGWKKGSQLNAGYRDFFRSLGVTFLGNLGGLVPS